MTVIDFLRLPQKLDLQIRNKLIERQQYQDIAFNSLYKTEAKGAERKIQDQSTGIVHALQGVGKPVGLTLDGMLHASIQQTKL